MKKVYLLLSKTNTFTSRLVHLVAPAPFTHASLALYPETDKFYSYARRRLYNFLIGGIMKENTKTFVFARFPECRCALFELDISDESYEKISSHIKRLMDDYDHSTYNFLGAPFNRLGIVWRRKKHFTCSQFVAVALANAEEIKFPKDPYLMMPSDFLKIEGLKKIYDGPIRDCNFSGASVFNKDENIKSTNKEEK